MDPLLADLIRYCRTFVCASFCLFVICGLLLQERKIV